MNATEPRPLFVPRLRDEPLPLRTLRAGAWEVGFGEGDLRYLRYHGTEIVRRIYAAVRDCNWGTVPATLHDLRVDEATDGNGFQVSFCSEHRTPGISFTWHGLIAADAAGLIRFSFEGRAECDFLRNRIGFCVLHPVTCAGTPVIARDVEGRERATVFPDLIAAEQPPSGFTDLAALRWEASPGARFELCFAGDAFELEDQRNWIDASFKTFCTPLRHPYPVLMRAGEIVRQEVTLRLLAPALTHAAPTRPPLREITIAVGNEVADFPLLGLGVSSLASAYDDATTADLRALELSHLRADVRLANSAWRERLDHALRETRALDLPLELALHLPSEPGLRDAREVFRHLRAHRQRLARVFAFRDGAKVTPPETLRTVREAVDDSEVTIGAGTDADFYQLNQSHPHVADGDFVTWSMNPQVHAFDLLSLAETPEAIPAQLASARRYFPHRPLIVGALTLRPRFNPVATREEVPPPDALPAAVDPRQGSGFAAAWALAALKHLAEGGVASVTAFETVGWRGLIERAAGSPLPARFRSLPSERFPLYHLFAALGPLRAGRVLRTQSSSPLQIESLAVRVGQSAALLVANLSPRARRFTIAFERVGAREHSRAAGVLREEFEIGPSRVVRIELPVLR